MSKLGDYDIASGLATCFEEYFSCIQATIQVTHLSNAQLSAPNY